MSESKRIKVYLSHSSGDSALGQKIQDLLETETNSRVFASKDLHSGPKWEATWRRELGGADLMITLLTPASVR
jgi:TIR domain